MTSQNDDAVERTIGQLVADATHDISSIMRSEVALAKAEIRADAKKAGVGAGMFAVAGTLAFLALILLVIAAANAASTASRASPNAPSRAPRTPSLPSDPAATDSTHFVTTSTSVEARSPH